MVALMAAGDAAAQPRPSGLLDFGMGFSDARLTVGDNTFSIYTNKRQVDSFLLEPAMKDMIPKNPSNWPLPIWRAAAEAFVRPIGCGISDVVAISRRGAAWEATYVCPPGVDLKALVKAERAELKAGSPLHLSNAAPPASTEGNR